MASGALGLFRTKPPANFGRSLLPGKKRNCLHERGCHALFQIPGKTLDKALQGGASTRWVPTWDALLLLNAIIHWNILVYHLLWRWSFPFLRGLALGCRKERGASPIGLLLHFLYLTFAGLLLISSFFAWGSHYLQGVLLGSSSTYKRCCFDFTFKVIHPIS